MDITHITQEDVSSRPTPHPGWHIITWQSLNDRSGQKSGRRSSTLPGQNSAVCTLTTFMLTGNLSSHVSCGQWLSNCVWDMIHAIEVFSGIATITISRVCNLMFTQSRLQPALLPVMLCHGFRSFMVMYVHDTCITKVLRSR